MSPEVIIVGAGVAGAALAYALAKDGRRVHMIERDLREPDRFVGEHLLSGGYLKLLDLGLQDCLEEIDAQQVLGYKLYNKGKQINLPHPFQKYGATNLGRNFHNGRFIQRMREKAASLPNVRMEQGKVTSLVDEKGVIQGVKYKTKDGQEFASYAPLTIISVSSWSMGLILENCQLPEKKHVHLVFAQSCTISIYQISSTEIRCFVIVPGQKLPFTCKGEMVNYLKTEVAPRVLSEIRDAFLVAIEKGNIGIMPNQSMPANPHPIPGGLLIGDALNMRHFVTGGGMTVALSDVVILRNLRRPLNKFPDPQTLSKCLESLYTLRKPMSSTLNIFGDGIHQLFTNSSDQGRKEIWDSCFDFLSLGGIFSNLAVELHSGLNPRPLGLLMFSFGLGVFVFGRSLLPFPSPERIWRTAKLLMVSIRLVFPLIWAEGIRQTYFPATIPVHFRTPPQPAC